jgi:hypothetical protein
MWKEYWLDLYQFHHRHHLMTLDGEATHANPDMWKEYQLLPVPPPAPLDGIG